MPFIFSSGLKSTAILVLGAVVGGLVLAFWFGQSVFQVAGTTIEARFFPSKQGLTRIAIPPLGEIRAKTHKFPVGISVSVERVSISQMQRLASSDFSQAELIEEIEIELREAGRKFVVRLLILAALGGLIAGLILPGRNLKRALAGTLIGLIALALPGYMVIKGYDVKAWRQPKYTGMLATAPWLLGTLEEKLNDFDVFRAEIRTLARNLHQFYSKIENWEPVKLGNGKIKVLHVGDIHNNPAAFDLISQVVRDFRVDLVVDTGDLTDLGTPLEAKLVSRVGSLGVPYVFVPGNHDSDSISSALRGQDNLVVADNKVVKVKGLKIFGAAGPATQEFTAEPVSGKELAEFIESVKVEYDSLDSKPNIVAIHSIRQAKELIGLAPLILTGHSHQPSLTTEKGTLIDDVGTTGAAGIRSFKVKDGIPYSLKLLYFSEGSKELIAVDSLALSGISRDFILERRLIDKDNDRLKNLPDSVSLNAKKPVVDQISQESER